MSEINNLTNTADTTASYETDDIQNNKIMAILCYIGILVLIPVFCAKNSKYVRYHANQGLILLIAEVVLSVISSLLGDIFLVGWIISLLCGLLGIVCFIFSIMGIINVINGKAKEIPVVGKFSVLK